MDHIKAERLVMMAASPSNADSGKAIMADLQFLEAACSISVLNSQANLRILRTYVWSRWWFDAECAIGALERMAASVGALLALRYKWGDASPRRPERNMENVENVSAEPNIADAIVRIGELEHQIFKVNDALFGLVGILSRLIVEAGVVSKDDLAAMIHARAGLKSDPDHLPTLAAFARAIRMTLPGGRFDVIDGGRTPVDPRST